jgi:hypothetical protein
MKLINKMLQPSVASAVKENGQAQENKNKNE